VELPREGFTLAYSYKRSLGPVLGAFFTALGEGRVLAARTASGQVIVPPCEWDPETGLDTKDLFEVGPEGTVQSWTWVGEPLARHPLDTPFAFALIVLDGAHTGWIQAVAVDGPEALRTGSRVKPRATNTPITSVAELIYELA
jgi:uncharacterized protein